MTNGWQWVGGEIGWRILSSSPTDDPAPTPPADSASTPLADALPHAAEREDGHWVTSVEPLDPSDVPQAGGVSAGEEATVAAAAQLVAVASMDPVAAISADPAAATRPSTAALQQPLPLDRGLPHGALLAANEVANEVVHGHVHGQPKPDSAMRPPLDDLMVNAALGSAVEAAARMHAYTAAHPPAARSYRYAPLLRATPPRGMP